MKPVQQIHVPKMRLIQMLRYALSELIREVFVLYQIGTMCGFIKTCSAKPCAIIALSNMAICRNNTSDLLMNLSDNKMSSLLFCSQILTYLLQP